MLQGPEEGDYCKRGEPVACGQRLRLEHLTTNRNLHSHHFTRWEGGSGQEVQAGP